jgi:hypothetical protein
MRMIKGLFALIYEDMLNEFNMNNSPKWQAEKSIINVYKYLLGVNTEKGDG